MDYYNYSKAPNYFVLVKNFPGISAVLLKKVNQLLGEGFSGDKGFIFGFSFGAHLAFDVGVKTDGQIERIDGYIP